MQTNDTILIAVLTVLVLLVAYQGLGGAGRKSCEGCTDGFAAGAAPPRDCRAPGPVRPPAPERPNDFSGAEAALWSGTAADMDSEDASFDNAAPEMDYAKFLTDSVADPHMRDSHRRWAEEMKPWSGGAVMVDDMDEAMEASTHFVGLRRPQAVAQRNPYQITEQDSNTFAGNAKFNFLA